jgi:ligand-binding sensor protein
VGRRLLAHEAAPTRSESLAREPWAYRPAAVVLFEGQHVARRIDIRFAFCHKSTQGNTHPHVASHNRGGHMAEKTQIPGKYINDGGDDFAPPLANLLVGLGLLGRENTDKEDGLNELKEGAP